MRKYLLLEDQCRAATMGRQPLDKLDESKDQQACKKQPLEGDDNQGKGHDNRRAAGVRRELSREAHAAKDGVQYLNWHKGAAQHQHGEVAHVGNRTASNDIQDLPKDDHETNRGTGYDAPDVHPIDQSRVSHGIRAAQIRTFLVFTRDDDGRCPGNDGYDDPNDFDPKSIPTMTFSWRSLTIVWFYWSGHGIFLIVSYLVRKGRMLLHESMDTETGTETRNFRFLIPDKKQKT